MSSCVYFVCVVFVWCVCDFVCVGLVCECVYVSVCAVCVDFVWCVFGICVCL